MTFLKKRILLLIVFVTGASVLIVEVVALRILAPYYGNTIFTVSSVLGIILAALSLGYYFGGRFADSHPSLKWFYSIILAGGLSILFLQLLVFFYLPKIGYLLSMVSGPLVSSIILFFLPSFFLGTLSPFAIKLQELKSNGGVGKISGEVFFWSTLGSIFGSLSAGFILIPNFGLNQIIITIGIFLTVIGVTAFLILGVINKKTTAKLIIVLILGVAALMATNLSSVKNVVYSRDGTYEKILIYDGSYKGRPTRFLMQDRSNSAAMFLDSDELVYDYTKYYALYKIFNSDTKEVLAIGGGAYSVPKAILSELPRANIDIAEIEPSLFELGKKFFRVPDNPRLSNHVEDGRRFLHDTDKKYDLIFSDVYYSLISIPTHFTTKEFFGIAKDKLSDDGIIALNFIGDLSPEPPSLIFSEIKTFQSVFPNSYFFAVESLIFSGRQNVIFVGTKSGKKIDWDDPQIKQSGDETIRNLSQRVINVDGSDFSPYLIITDDFAPIEYLTAKVLKKNF